MNDNTSISLLERLQTSGFSSRVMNRAFTNMMSLVLGKESWKRHARSLVPQLTILGAGQRARLRVGLDREHVCVRYVAIKMVLELM